MDQRPKYLKPGEESLYPSRNRDGVIEPLINPDTDAALSLDKDATSNFVYNRHHHLPYEVQRQKLPVFQYRNHILYMMERHQTLVLVGETGCGKTTQVPQYMSEVGHRVCVCEPRVVCAAGAARRVAAERGAALGEGVGYAAGMTAARTTHTRITYMTEGVLLREMFASPLLMQYTCIMLDEVHERSQTTDVLMGLLKKIAKKRKNLKLIISSATMEAEFVRDFFELNPRGRRSAAIMSIPGRVYPVQLYYLREPAADYVQATVDTVIKIHENEPFGDVLAFLTSQEEIYEAIEQLEKYASNNRETMRHRRHYASGIQCADISVLPMFGTLPHYAQIKVFQSADRNVRKVVIATNIAETSVTIPGIVYVIDCGFHKLSYFDPASCVQRVVRTHVAKSNALQRAGRAGRTSAGKCYRLYTESEYESLPASVAPEMCRSDLTYMLLQLHALGIRNVLRFPFPSPPPALSVLSALEQLLALQAVTHSPGQSLLTREGEVMAELPLAPMYAKILCTSGEFGCMEEALSIVSMLQVDSVFTHGAGRRSMAAKVARRNHFEVAEGDIIMYLNIMDSYLRLKSTFSDENKCRKACKHWCDKMYLNYNIMEKACEIRNSLDKLVKVKFEMTNKQYDEPDLGSGKLSRVQQCVTRGLFARACQLHGAAYRGLRGAELHVSPDSCLYATQHPPWVVYSSVECSAGRTCMRGLMSVRREWLLEAAPHYYRET